MAGGQAEPPITVRCICGSFKSCCAMWVSSICHTVGTPAAKVTPSAASS